MPALIRRLREAPEYIGQVAHYRYLPPVPARMEDFGSDLPASLQDAVRAMGIQQLYSHQADALRHLRLGQHVGVTTPTASGKTLIYNLGIFEKLLADPEAHALYLFPLKALAQDQLKIIRAFAKHIPDADLSAAIYDGDTSASERTKIKRKLPRIIFTNPDMLHYGLLAYPDAWHKFFQHLKFVVIDEAHTYRGIFGSHVSLIIRRLRRLCGQPGPTFVASSATMANAEEFLERLTGLPFTVIEKSGAPREGRHALLIEPTGSPYTQAAGMLQECLDAGVKTILFTKSRKITELISLWVQEGAPKHAAKIASYRSGYLPEERREIERRLFTDELSAVISTSALESGIDVGGLDACILVGYPGTMISTWQRLGRVGRQQRDALLILIALPDALDHYYLRKPDALFSDHFENCVLDAENQDLLEEHLPCAAAEEPLTPGDWPLFGTTAPDAVTRLTKTGDLNEVAGGNRWVASRKQPQRLISIRSVGQQYEIKLDRGGKVLGEIDSARVFKECHPGAIYLHAGQSFEVTHLDIESRTVLVRESDVDWYTQYTASEDIEILDQDERLLPMLRVSRREFEAGLVRVRVTERVVAYERHRIRDRGLISEHKLDLPPRVFETRAILLTVPEYYRLRCQEFSLDFAGGLHAAEHVLIAALPLHVLCERWDLGGLSVIGHPQVDQACIFIYDGYPGGVGLAQKGLEVLESWLESARTMVADCDCEEGCPACIHSPKCGSGNQPLDKNAAVLLLNAMKKVPPRRLDLAVKAAPTPVAAYRASETPAPASAAKTPTLRPGFRLVVFDLETQRSAQEVGGWDCCDKMGMSLGVVYDFATGEYTTYRMDRVPELIQDLLAADLVVGFNVEKFDLSVLSGYSPFARRIKTFDILAEIRPILGYHLSLDHLAKQTLGRGKTAEGLQAITWFLEGNWADLEKYCRADVEITRDLFLFGLKYRYLLFERKGVILKLPVDWAPRLPEEVGKQLIG
jgi:DEAD/DEAH box helicase domain-containing protein